MNDQNPGEGGAGEATEPTEPQTPAAPAAPTEPQEPKEPQEPSKGDPLDDIQDAAARAEAKAHRAIARRQRDQKPDAPAATPSQPTQQPAQAVPPKTVEYLAKQAVSDEVREHWDELMSIPLAGYDTTDPASIAQNMTERMTILKARPQKPADPARDLSVDAGIRGRTPAAAPAAKKSVIPRPLDADAQAKNLYG